MKKIMDEDELTIECFQCGEVIKVKPTCNIIGVPYCDSECRFKANISTLPRIRQIERWNARHEPRSEDPDLTKYIQLRFKLKNKGLI